MGKHAARNGDTWTAHSISLTDLRKGKLARTRCRGEYIVNRI